jgi:hypothetical protein
MTIRVDRFYDARSDHTIYISCQNQRNRDKFYCCVVVIYLFYSKRCGIGQLIHIYLFCHKINISEEENDDIFSFVYKINIEITEAL